MLILSWYRRARLAQLAHSRQAGLVRRAHWAIGIPATVLSAAVGSAVISQVAEQYQLVVGVMGLLAALLVGLQTFLRLDDRVREHEASSRQFGQIRRHLSQLGTIAGQPRESVGRTLDEVRERYDGVSEGSPNVSDRVWTSEKEKYQSYWPPEFLGWPERQQTTK
jgi:hypothetical protein